MVNNPDGKTQKNAEVIFSVKGRSDDSDKLTTAKCGSFSSTCYVTPTPGTGDVGTNCAMYKPNANNSSNVDPSLANGSTSLDQANYSCNWNKLVFGSSQTDRVAVPLYYDGSAVSGTATIVDPYKDGKAKNFVVRMRTPCKPCAPAGLTATADQRTCDGTVKDETVCDDKDRYVLDANSSDDIVVQWLINGECDEGGGKTEACGMMPVSQGVKNANQTTLTPSAFYESLILNNNHNTNQSSSLVLDGTGLAYDTNNYPSAVYLLQVKNNALSSTIKLDAMTKPVFSLFLSKPLLTSSKNNIPYLEYQVLTDSPVGNSKSTLDVVANVDGNLFHKTLMKEVQKALIDFAIHN